MRIFITGGTGFIGRPVCRALAGHELLVLARRPKEAGDGLRYLAGDIFAMEEWKKEFQAFGAEVCVHLAWAGLPDYSLETSRKNFAAGLDVIQLAREARCPRVVVSGTCFEYGNLTGAISEGQVAQKQGLFAAFKSAQRIVARSLLADSPTSLLWGRPFYVYGPGQRPTSLIPSCFSTLAKGGRPDIKSPDAINDFVHVDDVAAGIAALATGTAPAGDYNLGSGEATRVRDLVNLVARMMERPEVYPATDSPGSGFWADLARVRAYWQPRVSLEEGVGKTLAAWRAQP